MKIWMEFENYPSQTLPWTILLQLFHANLRFWIDEQNYGAHFENIDAGVHCLVELIVDGETIRNLSSEWHYKVGLDGEKSEFFNLNCQLREPWNYGNLPLNQNFVWYKVLNRF